MSEAESGRAVQPLTSLKLAPPAAPTIAATTTVASTDVSAAAQTDAAAATQDHDKPASIEAILNRLFSGR
jgi:hypothetical protein